jgi:hypothetical protein
MSTHRLLAWLLLLTLTAPATAERAGAASAPTALHYRLSYSGLITGYIWKELADVTLHLTPQPTVWRDEPAVRLMMEVTTKGYSVAETLHALRYRWESLLSPDLQRTLLVRVSDHGDSDSHEVYWYDWAQRLIALYRKREQRDVSIPMFDSEPILEWESDHLPPAPPFIDPHPEVAPGLGYLLQNKQRPGRLDRAAIDPLAMLLLLRQHNYRQEASRLLQIINEDDLAPYQARLLGTERLPRGDCHDPALKVEVRRHNESGEEGVMTLWLSDDAQRLPLRIDVDASLGMLHIELQSPPCQPGAQAHSATAKNLPPPVLPTGFCCIYSDS